MKKELPKFLRSFALFAPFTVLLYLLLVCIWGELGSRLLNRNLNYRIGSAGYMYTRLKEAKVTKNIDVLFLGSSHAYRGFDTRIFAQSGISSFNLGSSAQTPMQTEVLLKRYLKSLNPKMIIYEVYPTTFSIDGVESALDLIANDKNDLESVMMAIDLNNIKVYNTLIYGFYRDFSGRNNSFHEKLNQGKDRYIHGGFVEKELIFNHPELDTTTRTWDLNDQQFYSFKKIIKLINELGIKLVLVQAPITKTLYGSYRNNDEFDARMEKYGEYYNFNEILGLDDSLHFYDHNHLNTNGVKLFNRALITSVFGNK